MYLVMATTFCTNRLFKQGEYEWKMTEKVNKQMVAKQP